MSEATHVVDRSRWHQGPWDKEPDREEWRHLGLPCLIVRNRMGGLCGYVGVPPGHPWHGKEMDDVDAEVHGGITYAAPCAEGGAICHVPLPGEPESVWWVGFDCVHLDDYAPGEGRQMEMDGTYKPLAYVRAEVESLAQQALDPTLGSR